MTYYCTMPMDMKKDSTGGMYYVHCGEKATHFVDDSEWCVCEAHAAYAKAKRWSLTKIEEEDNDDKKDNCGCGQLNGLECC